MQKKWFPTGNKFILLSILNMEMEQNHLEGEGGGPSFAKFFRRCY